MLNLLGPMRSWSGNASGEGIAAATAAGEYKGRAPTAWRQVCMIVSLKDEGRTVAEIMAAIGAGRSSVFSILKEAGRTGERGALRYAVGYLKQTARHFERVSG